MMSKIKSESFTVLTWNVQGVRNYTQTNFKDVIPIMDEADADIMCLQEMPNAVDKIAKIKNIDTYNKCISKLNGNYDEKNY